MASLAEFDSLATELVALREYLEQKETRARQLRYQLTLDMLGVSAVGTKLRVVFPQRRPETWVVRGMDELGNVVVKPTSATVQPHHEAFTRIELGLLRANKYDGAELPRLVPMLSEHALRFPS